MPSLAEPHGFGILYEDGPCLVVAKPGGVSTQAPPGIESLEVRVKKFLHQRAGSHGDWRDVYLGVPHRLDRPASGTLVLALSRKAARRLARQFEARSVEKTYWAVVEGVVAEDQGEWRDYIRKVENVARAELVPPEAENARLAVLRYRVLARLRGLSWLEIQLVTGRMHQARLQAASRGHPVVGDAMYGAVTRLGPPADDPREDSIALFARRLKFRHPESDQQVEVDAPLPATWAAMQLPVDSV